MHKSDAEDCHSYGYEAEKHDSPKDCVHRWIKSLHSTEGEMRILSLFLFPKTKLRGDITVTRNLKTEVEPKPETSRIWDEE
jgi:hypothetical protein